jgi:acyl-CoA synthetase (AMP-forming)/AMP-acid ligase II
VGVRDRVALFRARDLTLGTLLERLADIYGDRPLATEDGRSGVVRYRDAADQVARWAGALASRLDPGDRVVVATPSEYRTFLLYLAVCRAGGVVVPVNTKMRDAEIAHIVDDAGAVLVIRHLDQLATGPVSAARRSHPGEVAAVLYTSGTTGRPKGAQLSHRALLGLSPAGALLPVPLGRGEAVSALPVGHISGLSLLLILAGLGLPVHLVSHFRPDSMLDILEQRRSSMFVGVPAMYQMMLEAGAVRRDLRSVRLWASGGDAMPYDLARRFQAMGSALTLPAVRRPVGHAAFVDGYGMVELAGGVAVKLSPPGLPLRTAGLLGFPLPGHRMRVVDQDGRRVRRGNIGELVVRGPGVMVGYRGQPAATAATLTAGGWLRTGDLARRRPLGLVEFVGRQKDVIKHGGYSVFPAEVEAVLTEHPAVAEAAVIGLDDPRKGQIPVAVVRLVGPPSEATADELQAWVHARLADYKVPVRTIFCDELPRTGMNKVHKPSLAALFTTP